MLVNRQVKLPWLAASDASGWFLEKLLIGLIIRFIKIAGGLAEVWWLDWLIYHCERDLTTAENVLSILTLLIRLL